MADSNTQKIAAIIKKLKRLEKYAKYYRERWPSGEIDHRGLNTGADNYWSQNGQPLVEEIDLDLENIWSYLTTYTKQGDNFGGYCIPIGTPEENLRCDINHVIESRDPEHIHSLIQHIKKVQARLEIKSQPVQEQKPKSAEDLAAGKTAVEKKTKTDKPKHKSKRKKKTPKLKWSRPMTKSQIITALRLDSVYKLNALLVAKTYKLKQVGTNRQLWQIRIENLDRDIQEKLK